MRKAISLAVLLILMVVFNMVDPTEKAKRLNNKGVTLLEKGDASAALQLFIQAIDQDDKIATIWNHKGLALASMKRFAEACDAFQRAESLARDNSEYRINRALTLITMEEFDKAEEIGDSILSTHNDEPNALYIKGTCLARKGKFSQALDAYRLLMQHHQEGFKGSLEAAKKNLAFLEECVAAQAGNSAEQ